jgi:trehalose 6-phosphate phosphatase
VDGTLIEIAPTPDTVRVPRGLPRLLGHLHDRMGGALALVSGRPIAEIDRLFAPVLLPAAGVHGAEIRLHGPIERMAGGFEDGAAVRAAVAAFAAAHPGLRVEDKGAALALHYRGAPALERPVDHFAAALARQFRLHLQAGKCVAELKASPSTKGDALRRMMAAAPFAGRVPVMVGDDLTDEHGFEAARALGGLALRVGAAERPSAATARIPTPADLRRRLAGWVGVNEKDVA